MDGGMKKAEKPAGGGEKKETQGRGSLLGRLSDFAALAKQSQFSLYASSGAFYLFLALFPTAALLVSLLPLFPFTEEAVLEYISAIIPDVMRTLLQDIISGMYVHNVAVFSVSAVVLVWSAGRAFYGILRGLSVVYCGEVQGSYFRLRGLSSLYMLVFIITMILTLALGLFQDALFRAFQLRWPQSTQLVSTLLRLRFLPAMLLLAAFFGLLYKFMPPGRRRYLDQVPGALGAAALWTLLSWAFTLYLNRFGPTSVYGSLATVALSLLWIYWCIAITLLGGVFNIWLSGIKPKRD